MADEKPELKLDFTFTKEQLTKIVDGSKFAVEYYDALMAVMPKYEITSKLRVAAFIAQVAHESGGFKFTKENLNYGQAGLRTTFSKYFPNDMIAKEYERKPEKIANKVYGGRMGNGPESSGDGWKYCGRGLIQLTGKDNYTKFAAAIKMDLDKVSAYLETKEGAVESACWFWSVNNLNTLADKKDITLMTKRINGGNNGLADRIKHYDLAVSLFGA